MTACTCPPGGPCDEEGDMGLQEGEPGCEYCRLLDSEWPCPAERDQDE